MNTSVALMKKNDLKEINKLRKSEDLPPIEPGTVVCLRCDAKFESWDKRNNRVCDECKNDDDYYMDVQCHGLSRFDEEQLGLPTTITEELEWISRPLQRKTHSSRYRYFYDNEDDLLDTTLMDREDL